jgi:hypothetical protein
MSTNTATRIKQAIVRIEKGRTKTVTPDRKLSIASVAEETGIHRSTIINRHPILAQEIRDKTGVKGNSDDAHNRKINELERKLDKANKEIVYLNEQLAKAVSLQATEIIRSLK